MCMKLSLQVFVFALLFNLGTYIFLGSHAYETPFKIVGYVRVTFISQTCPG